MFSTAMQCLSRKNAAKNLNARVAVRSGDDVVLSFLRLEMRVSGKDTCLYLCDTERYFFEMRKSLN